MNAPSRRAAAAACSDDGAAIDAVAAGDLTGLGVLFDRHGDSVRRLLGRIGVAREDVDDLTQQTFLEVVSAAQAFRSGLAVRPWILGIALMLARRRRRSIARLRALLRECASSLGERIAPPPHVDLEGARQIERAQRAFEKLSLEQREVFALVVLEGVSGREAATALGIPVATVWTRLHYARGRLRQALDLEQP